MGSKRLTKSSLAQIRNPYSVINLKKEKRSNKDSDIQALINGYSLGNVTPPSRPNVEEWKGLLYPKHCCVVINHFSQNCSDTRP